MQGPVYGISTSETDIHSDLCTSFHYDDIFGTVLNRFLTQVVAGVPITIYGEGGQTRGYLNINDTIQCVELAINNPANKGELRILNQFTETFSVMQLAKLVNQHRKAWVWLPKYLKSKPKQRKRGTLLYSRPYWVVGPRLKTHNVVGRNYTRDARKNNREQN